MLENKTFWLSTNPEAVGVKAWDAALERVATWGKFRDRASGCTYVHLNTHFDHIGETARQESAKLIRRRLSTIAGTLPVIVTGDLNSGPTSIAYTTLTSGAVDGGLAPLLDAFKISREGNYGPSASFNSFKEIGDTRIDYVMVSSGIDVLKHGILSDRWDQALPVGSPAGDCGAQHSVPVIEMLFSEGVQPGVIEVAAFPPNVRLTSPTLLDAWLPSCDLCLNGPTTLHCTNRSPSPRVGSSRRTARPI